jgi:hypothetical protein
LEVPVSPCGRSFNLTTPNLQILLLLPPVLLVEWDSATLMLSPCTLVVGKHIKSQISKYLRLHCSLLGRNAPSQYPRQHCQAHKGRAESSTILYFNRSSLVLQEIESINRLDMLRDTASFRISSAHTHEDLPETLSRLLRQAVVMKSFVVLALA